MFIDNDNDGFTADVDCDDNNSLSYPGTLEICDGEDNDCNGIVDDNIEGYSNPSNIASKFYR